MLPVLVVKDWSPSTVPAWQLSIDRYCLLPSLHSGFCTLQRIHGRLLAQIVCFLPCPGCLVGNTDQR